MEIFILHAGEQSGPHSYGSVKDNLDSGVFSLNDLAWTQGLDSWKPLWKLLGVEQPPTKGAAQAEAPQKQKHIGRTWKTLRTLPDFFELKLATKTILSIVALLLIASWVYPPWVHYGRYQRESPEVTHGWFFVFDTQQQESGDISRIVMRIDLGRLLLIDGIIAVAGWMFITNRRLAFYSLLAALIIGLGCFVAVRIQREAAQRAAQQQRAAEERAAQEQTAAEEQRAEAERITRKQKQQETLDKDISTPATASEILRAIQRAQQLGCSDEEIYDSLVENFGGFTAIEELAGIAYGEATSKGYRLAGTERALLERMSEEASMLNSDDLKKVILFDITPVHAYDDGSFLSFRGRIRSTLSRPVKGVKLKASFYDTQGKLISVLRFADLREDGSENGRPIEPLIPNEPRSFEVSLHNENVPQGSKWSFEVIDAHYPPVTTDEQQPKSDHWWNDPIVK